MKLINTFLSIETKEILSNVENTLDNNHFFADTIDTSKVGVEQLRNDNV